MNGKGCKGAGNVPEPENSTSNGWTKPYCGLTYLGGPKGGRWVSVAVDSDADHARLTLFRGYDFRGQDFHYSTVEEAKRAGERWIVEGDWGRVRRGAAPSGLDVTGHALDRASLRCLDLWASTRQENEGLHAWLCRMAAEALAANVAGDQRRVLYAGIKFGFGRDGGGPVLETVMPAKRREPRKRFSI